MENAIYFDMDGTIANLYGVENWLAKLIASDTSPYMEAKPLVNLSILARYLNKLKENGFIIGIVSWLSKSGTDEYNAEVSAVKINWLKKHLPSVDFDEIHIVAYGTPKQTVIDNPNGILFDDEKPNRDAWLGTAYDVDNIISTLKELLESSSL